MRFGDWLRKTFAGRRPTSEMVPFYDAEAGRVVQIPASELRPGFVRIRLEPGGESAWALAAQFCPSTEFRYPEFDELHRNYIRRIQTVFAEHRPLSLKEWEDGFRCDVNMEYEIALWLVAADTYLAFAGNEPDLRRRRDVYGCILTCMTSDPDNIWNVFRPEALSRAEAEQIVSRCFRGKRPDVVAAPGPSGA